MSRYSLSHTHPSHDSDISRGKDGTLTVYHNIHIRQSLIATTLLRSSSAMFPSDILATMNAKFPTGGWNKNHIEHAVAKMVDQGIIERAKGGYKLTRNAIQLLKEINPER